MRVLVTGGAGFLGMHLCRALRARGDEVTVYEHLPTALPWGLERLAGVGEVVDGDILDGALLEKVLGERRIQKIIHCAAIVGVAQSVGIEHKVAAVNILGALNVFEAVRKSPAIETCVNISSEEVYGEFTADPIPEESPCAPVSPYGISKYTAERYGDYYRRKFGCGIVSLRTSWVYGPGLPRNRVPRDFILSILKEGRISEPQGGEQKLDFTYIDDFVQGVLLACERSPRFGVYNIASGTGHTLAELAGMLQALCPGTRVDLGAGLMPFDAERRVTLPQKGALDISRAAQDLGYAPRFPAAKGVAAYLDYLRDNEY